MKSAATTNTDDLKKVFREQLQIDADLANATDVTAPLSFTTPVSNRTGNDNGEDDDWETFYEGLEKTPPKSTRDVEFGTAVEKANNLLRLSDLEEFATKTFENLTKDQQAIMMLMVTKKMDEVFDGGAHQVAKILVGALDPETHPDEYEALMAFVRAGGDLDEKVPFTSEVVDLFNKARETFAMGSEDVKTIFDKKEGMMPFLHVQRQKSSICTFNACAVLLYYCSYDIGDQKAIRANISRYIRDEIDGLKIANLTLTTQKGASLSETLTGLMLNFGTVPPEVGIHKIIFFENDEEDWIYTNLAHLLQMGRPFAFLIECFPALNDLTKKQYTGKLSDHYQDVDYGKRPKDRPYHAVVCIGTKPRKGTMPPMLLVQDSCDGRPAFQIGLDLLMDMGTNNLHFCTLPEYWKPNTKMRYKVTKKTRVHLAGSPMAIDKNDKPYIIPRKEPVPRDMSKYLHPPPSKPGMPEVYYT